MSFKNRGIISKGLKEVGSPNTPLLNSEASVNERKIVYKKNENTNKRNPFKLFFIIAFSLLILLLLIHYNTVTENDLTQSLLSIENSELRNQLLKIEKSNNQSLKNNRNNIRKNIFGHWQHLEEKWLFQFTSENLTKRFDINGEKIIHKSNIKFSENYKHIFWENENFNSLSPKEQEGNKGTYEIIFINFQFLLITSKFQNEHKSTYAFKRVIPIRPNKHLTK